MLRADLDDVVGQPGLGSQSDLALAPAMAVRRGLLPIFWVGRPSRSRPSASAVGRTRAD